MAPQGAMGHISYGHIWNGIPVLPNWSGHNIWNGMGHSIPAGMEWLLFILVGLECFISFMMEWNDPTLILIYYGS